MYALVGQARAPGTVASVGAGGGDGEAGAAEARVGVGVLLRLWVGRGGGGLGVEGVRQERASGGEGGVGEERPAGELA